MVLKFNFDLRFIWFILVLQLISSDSKSANFLPLQIMRNIKMTHTYYTVNCVFFVMIVNECELRNNNNNNEVKNLDLRCANG